MRRSIQLAICALLALVIIVGSLVYWKNNQQQEEKQKVRAVVLSFKDAVEKGDPSLSYSIMSTHYKTEWSEAVFKSRMKRYREKMAMFSGRERIYLGRRNAQVYLAAPSADAGVVMELVKESDWRVDSLDALWMKE